MRLLLDTHAFLWWQANDARLAKSVRDAILDPGSEVWVSVVSAWEIAIKVALGRLTIPEPVEPAVERNGFGKLPVTFAHAEQAGSLPRHHGDPFDRMLIAQAQVEELTLVSRDGQLGAYGIPLFWK